MYKHLIGKNGRNKAPLTSTAQTSKEFRYTAAAAAADNNNNPRQANKSIRIKQAANHPTKQTDKAPEGRGSHPGERSRPASPST